MIEDVRMECADNGGYIIRYTERTKPTGGSELSNCNYNYKTESFGSEESVKALARLQELAGKLKKDGEGESGTSPKIREY